MNHRPQRSAPWWSYLTVASALVLIGCEASSSRPPGVTFAQTSPIQGKQQYERFHRGDQLSEPMFNVRAEAPMVRVFGTWTDDRFIKYTAIGTYYGRAKEHRWHLKVLRWCDPQVERALTAKDADEAKLGAAVNASAYLYARLNRKNFRWGKAVSYFTQYQNDNTIYVPNNGMLTYEVAGITADRRFTVRASFGVTHPGLTEFGPDVRDSHDHQVIKKDPSYRLVETAKPESFQPSLIDIDALLDTIQIQD